MCGIAGFYSKDEMPLKDMRVVLDEIGIRGIHSTGVSWDNGGLRVKIDPVPYNEFVIPDEPATGAVFHTRYSTSNIDYPQPVYTTRGPEQPHYSDEIIEALVHNGVITQEPFENWKDKYGYKGENKCDSVLLLEDENNEMRNHPLVDYPDSSMAVIMIEPDPWFYFGFYRNEQRPLYYVEHSDLIVVASTKRAIEYFGKPVACEPCVHYSMDLFDWGLKAKEIRKPKKDLQYAI